jgi:hypothetical protein
MVRQLNGYMFKWNKDNTKDMGVKAQEVEKVIPEIVKETKLPFFSNDDKDYKVVQYEKLVALLIEAQKEQDDKVEKLMKEVEDLKKQVLILKNKK